MNENIERLKREIEELERQIAAHPFESLFDRKRSDQLYHKLKKKRKELAEAENLITGAPPELPFGEPTDHEEAALVLTEFHEEDFLAVPPPIPGVSKTESFPPPTPKVAATVVKPKVAVAKKVAPADRTKPAAKAKPRAGGKTKPAGKAKPSKSSAAKSKAKPKSKSMAKTGAKAGKKKSR